MNLVFFAHPDFINSQSMSRFARMISNGMKIRGHEVSIWTPKARFAKLNIFPSYKKWFGYIDQYIIFPTDVRKSIKSCPPGTLFVITDNALGPWVPLVKNLPHVIHCNDLLAQRSALGEISENPTSWTGKQYQAFIRRGYQKGKRFISISCKTREDLNLFLNSKPLMSEVVYLGLNSSFTYGDPIEARVLLSKTIGIDITNGYLLHVGGNQWYKNRVGVVEIYNSWRSRSKIKLPLILMGEKPNLAISKEQEKSLFKHDIYFLSGMSNDFLRLAYTGASVLLFPSIAEGFGWPIAEAMACGCPVITTNEAPMTEVAGQAGFLIPRRPIDEKAVEIWALESSKVVDKVLQLSPSAHKEVIETGLENARRFNPELYLNKIEALYKEILQTIESK